MSEIKIVEYQPQYARGVADMWNRSSSGWNGRVFNSSEKLVQNEEENTSYLNLYLAVADTLVVGYAKFKLYPEEQGVCYIEMLNADPAWHGKGVGKALVKQCVVRAAELGFERLDLFTWAGNTKAVPLYKKCGFFWEKMEMQATHLMNFIPGLLNNALLKPYFDRLDWYDDFQRSLEIEPDGRWESGFDLFDCVWEKGELRLQVTFEKQGRGIVSISTPDFRISTLAENAKPVFGMEYPVAYRLESLSPELPEITLRGEDDGVVQFALEHSPSQKGSTEVHGSFYLKALDKELIEWDTCPGVVTKLSIGGKSIKLKCGLKIQYPLTASLAMENSTVEPNSDRILFLNIKNNFPCPCRYRIEFTDTAPLRLKESRYEIELSASEKRCIAVEFSTPEAAVFYPILRVVARPEAGKAVEFDKTVHLPIQTLTSKAQKLMQDKYCLLNGINYFWMFHAGQKNWGSFSSINGMDFNICPPGIGMPYSEEFEQEMPYNAEVYDRGFANELVMYYRSKDFAGVDFARIYRLYPTGLLECSIRIINLPESENDIYTQFKIGMPGEGLSFEKNGRLIELESDLPELDSTCFDGETIESNWLFAKKDTSSCAVIWDKKWKGRFDRWWITWDLNLSEYKRQGLAETEILSMYIDVYWGVNSVRNAANGKNNRVELVYPSLELIVNNGNPFLQNPYEIKLCEHKAENLRGTFTLSSCNGSIHQQETSPAMADEMRSLTWQAQAAEHQAMDIIRCEARFPLASLLRQQVVFHPMGEVKVAVSSDDTGEFILADNGIIRITAPQHPQLPALVSLRHKEREWLDSGYPDYAPKSYYNPYMGGMGAIPASIGLKKLMNEKHEAHPACLKDPWGNKWQGLAIRTAVNEFEPLCGLIYLQYYLLLPGVPLMAIVTEIVEKPEVANYNTFSLNSCFHPEADLSNCKMKLQSDNKHWKEVNTGGEQFSLHEVSRHFTVQSKQSPEILNLTSLRRTYYDIHTDPNVIKANQYIYSEFNCTPPALLTPVFVILSEEALSYEWLYPLLSMRFTRE